MERNKRYLEPTPGGRWGISRKIVDRIIDLIQDSPLDRKEDASIVLRALNIPYTQANLDLYFPVLKGKGRCPTLDLLELCNVLDPTNPMLKKEHTKESGV